MQRSAVLRYSTFSVHPETARAPHGPPRGLINRFVSVGLPPWAAWCQKLSRYSIYRMSDTRPRGFIPKYPQEMDVIYLNERVRERVRTSKNVQNVYRQLKYPWTKLGLHHSDILDHWVQVPMVEAATFQVETDGGFDNFILKRSGSELKSKYGERIRRHLLVRKKEIEKNFVLEQQAKHLASVITQEMKQESNEAEAEAAYAQVLDKYGITKEELVRLIAAREFESRRSATAVAEEPREGDKVTP
jgi:large subunit ribosomal protein L28